MNRKTVLSCIFLVVVVTAPAFALMRKLTLDELVGNAEMIATGKVVKKECQWGERGKWIYTYATISVDEYIKGSEDKEIIVRHPGGEVGRKGLIVGNMPSFREGEEVLIFLRKMDALEVLVKEDTSRVYEVSGLAQGKYGISADETGRKMIGNNFCDLFIQDADGMRIMDEKVLWSKPLFEFILDIRQVLSEIASPVFNTESQ